jgi:carbon-monoxide dehydrogenase iron sulfur subunit
MKTVFVNPERCVGCRQCEFACAVEHSLSREPTQAVFESPAPRPRIHVTPGRAYATSFPNKCRHCDPAPCEQVCPTGAITRDRERGLVQSDARRCIACAMCAMVCPFDVISFHEFADGGPARITALKCDGCVQRIDAGRQPACVEACKTGALMFGDINRLIEAGRVRDTTALLSAAAATPLPASAMPEGISGWRAWGEAATHLNEGVHHGHH